MNHILLFASAFVLSTSIASAQTVTIVHGQKVVVPSAPARGQAALPTGYVPPSPTTPPPVSFLVGGSDNCATADPIAGAGTFAVNTTAATDSTQQTGFCPTAHNDVWFAWTSTQSGTTRITLCGGTTVDTVLAAYPGSACPAAGSQVACNDDFCGPFQSQILFTSTGGSVYLIQIGSYSAGNAFSGTFAIDYPAPPTNDDCTTPISLVGIGPFSFDNTFASTSTQGQSEPLCNIGAGTAIPRDMWYSWTATFTSTAVQVTTCTLTTVDTKVAVYNGAGCPTAASIACDDSSCGLQAIATFACVSGQTYTIQLGTSAGATAGGTGSFELVDVMPPPPVPASLNVDVGSPTGGFGVPTSAYGAGAAQPGYWNAISSGTVGTQPPLNDLNGANSGVLISHAGGNADFSFNNAGTMGDDQALMDDAQDLGTGSATWTFSNLYGGNYTVYTYAWAPDSATYVSSVSVAGSPDPTQTVGGAWPGTQTLGVTYALHHVTGVPFGGSIVITIGTSAILGTLNGFQIVETSSPFTAYCFGDGTGTACPCANNGLTGNGCANSVNANGANLAASGTASVAADTLVLSGTGMPNSSCLYFQGTTQTSTVFGDGLRCAGGQIFRLGTKVNSGGSSQYPAAGDLSVSVRGFVPAGGGVRTYQCWYRNPANFCTPSTFNLSNGLQVTWTP